MFSGYDFVYDGKSSISENLKLLYVDGNAFESVKGIPDKTINTFHTNGSSKWHISGVTMAEPLSFDIQILFHGDGEDEYKKLNPVIERNRLSRITHWLFDVTGYKKFQILTDDLRDLYFMAIFQNVDYLENGGEVYGFKATVLCDTIGAYEEKTVVKNFTGADSTFYINVLQDGIYEVAPTYIIEPRSSTVNMIINGKGIDLKNVMYPSTITIDTEKLIATSSEGENLYVDNKFSISFPRFKYGKNIIASSDNFKLTIKYKMIREVGC